MVTKEKAEAITMVVTKEGDHYLARAEGLSIFTEATSLDELKHNIREAVLLHLEGGEYERHGLPANPAIEVISRYHGEALARIRSGGRSGRR